MLVVFLRIYFRFFCLCFTFRIFACGICRIIYVFSFFAGSFLFWEIVLLLAFIFIRTIIFLFVVFIR